jgi:hypothetical protein
MSALIRGSVLGAASLCRGVLELMPPRRQNYELPAPFPNSPAFYAMATTADVESPASKIRPGTYIF